MPISEEEVRHPKWVRIEERYPLSYDSNDKYMKFETYPRNYRGGEFKQPGYNPNHNKITVEKVNLNSDTLQFRGN